jgi:3-(3-hydroxy-phenyl)propionate hydroxylase
MPAAMNARDIVVVGAGPVGLTAALAVRATGRPVTVVDAGGADRLRPGSRAIFLHRVTLEVLERIRAGLGWELARQGLSWRTKRTLFRGREVFRRTYDPPPAGVIPAATSLPQVATEAVLLAACRDAGVDFVWNYDVAAAQAGQDGVALRAATGEPLTARYVIGADGARSAVRESAGLRLEGPRTSSAFVIVDTAEDPADPLPIERVFHYEHPDAGFRNVLLVPFAGHWRVDLQCRPDDDPDAYGSDRGVREWLARVMPPKYAERVTWVSTYVFRQAIANRFVDATGRILLAGEAAHVFAPFGARGLNSGVSDAFVAARAIDRALADGHEAGIHPAVSAFGNARRAAAMRNRAASSTALTHLEAATPMRRAVRRAAALVAASWPPAGAWMDRAPYGPPLGDADRDGMYY